MLKWITPDADSIHGGAWNDNRSRRFGSDSAPANIVLLSSKYDTKTALLDGALLRYYNGSKPNRRGYGFPLFSGDKDLGDIVAVLRDDAAERGVQFGFCLCDERQKAALDAVCRIDWNCTDDDSDYIYKTESLAALSGKKLHRKRNHINNFRKMYDDVRYSPLSESNAADALTVAQKWFEERSENVTADELYELESIRFALANTDKLGISGGVLYVGGVPAAMTAASQVSDAVTDVHYEKAWGEFAANGAFTVINQCFAASVTSEYINREEDMGIEGLRTAKESYFPAFKLKKYYGAYKG
ncbi:MAG: DUF2156 domain-containing protein [Ruminiclostridium sp.]|nr:DUF2156 domain-containing protein [Ruminiclostridium sp.]